MNKAMIDKNADTINTDNKTIQINIPFFFKIFLPKIVNTSIKAPTILGY